MTTDKKNLPQIRIISYNGDLTKNWVIEWWEGGKRFQKKKGINGHQTVKGRTQAAEALKAEWLLILSEKIDGFSGTLYNKQYQLIMSYIEAKKGGWKKSSEQSIRTHINKFLEWNQRAVITRNQIEHFLDHLANLNRKRNTLSGYYKSFRLVIGNCLGLDLVEDLQVKKGEGTPARYFSDGQVSCRSRRNKLLNPLQAARAPHKPAALKPPFTKNLLDR